MSNTVRRNYKSFHLKPVDRPCLLEDCEGEHEAALDRIADLEAALVRAKAALVDDAADLWRVTNAIKTEIKDRQWIAHGRGHYEWDDDRYREETRAAFEAVLELIEGVQHPAQLRFHAKESR